MPASRPPCRIRRSASASGRRSGTASVCGPTLRRLPLDDFPDRPGAPTRQGGRNPGPAPAGRVSSDDTLEMPPGTVDCRITVEICWIVHTCSREAVAGLVIYKTASPIIMAESSKAGPGAGWRIVWAIGTALLVQVLVLAAATMPVLMGWLALANATTDRPLARAVAFSLAVAPSLSLIHI